MWSGLEAHSGLDPTRLGAHSGLDPTTVSSSEQEVAQGPAYLLKAHNAC